MKGNTLIRKISMECPLCDKNHELEERKRRVSMVIKGEEIEYEEKYYCCLNCDEDENEFAPAKLENENLLAARNAYRIKHGLLTSNEIVEIRESYGLSQVDMARLLGWGEATISRYESKAIQDEVYDNVLRMIRDNPFRAFKYLQKNSSKFNAPKTIEIRDNIIDNMECYGHEYIKRQALESEYVKFQEPSDANGNQSLDIDKIENIISYFAETDSKLYKVKLMKLLWYADALSYKQTGKSMTGLVYRHNNMGALPIGHYRIVDLENVNVDIEESLEYTKYHFLPNKDLDMSCLSTSEIIILEKVFSKFKNFSAQDIVNYMHNEIAYKETKDGEIIQFNLAKQIRNF